jgi:hypothetical protein
MVTVHSKADAKRLREEIEAGRSAPVPGAAQVAAPSGAGAAGLVADGTDGIELDFDELAEAQRAIDRKYDELAAHLKQAQELSGPLRDGKGPVTTPMRKAFGVRGGEAGGGVQAALASYLDELDRLRIAIRQVAADHQGQDTEAATALDKVGKP